MWMSSCTRIPCTTFSLRATFWHTTICNRRRNMSSGPPNIQNANTYTWLKLLFVHISLWSLALRSQMQGLRHDSMVGGGGGGKAVWSPFVPCSTHRQNVKKLKYWGDTPPAPRWRSPCSDGMGWCRLIIWCMQIPTYYSDYWLQTLMSINQRRAAY